MGVRRSRPAAPTMKCIVLYLSVCLIASVSCGRKRNKENNEKRKDKKNDDNDRQCGVEYYWAHSTEYKTECTQSYHTECTQEYTTECGYHPRFKREDHTLFPLGPPHQLVEVPHVQQHDTLFPLGPSHQLVEVPDVQHNDVCHQVPVEHCHQVPAQSCHEVPVRVPRRMARRVC